MLTYILIGLLLFGVGYLIFRKREQNNNLDDVKENARLKAEVGQKDQYIGKLKEELQNEKTSKDELSGKNKQMFVEVTNLKAEKNELFAGKEKLVKENINFKTTEESRAKEFSNKIEKLNEAQLSLEDEKKRIRREDEERLEKEKEQRDRMWAEHEDNVKNQLTELCKSPQYGFSYYDNNSLPISFAGKFKPDFLVEFLGQYIIFDAKVSESDLQNYINGNVKSTVEKINGNSKIYSTVFFVVPTDGMKLLKKIRFYEQGYEFFVIPPEALEIVLASFKKINSYELAQQLDPRDRENIVNIIAEFDYHINMRNALDILASESGVSVLKKANILKSDIKDEIQLKKGAIRLQQFAPTDIKTLMVNTESQEERIDELISPKAAISEDNLKKTRPILGKKSKS